MVSEPKANGAARFLPAGPKATLAKLRTAARMCRGCDLYKNATQTVFGAGSKTADMVLVGEQPGDQEDRAGLPFVDPAGRLLDQALAAAGIEKESVYITNAVKHFKWTPRGKRRLHARPSAREVHACRPWLEREIQIIRPGVIVTLGATAGQSLFGASFRVNQWRGKEKRHSQWAGCVVATVHPSALLRLPDRSDFDAAFAALVKDLKTAAAAAAEYQPAKAGQRPANT